MKVDIKILIGLGVVIIGVIVFIFIRNNKKNKDEDDKKDNNKRLNRLENALRNAGIDTLEDFTETTSTAPEEKVYTKSELFEIIDLYYSKFKCVLEKLFDDGIDYPPMNISLEENSDGTVSRIRTRRNSHTRDIKVRDSFTNERIGEVILKYYLPFVLEHGTLDDWYDYLIGILAYVKQMYKENPNHKGLSGRLWAKYDKEHEDPYRTLVIYWDKNASSTDQINKNTEDYVENDTLMGSSTNEDGSEVLYLKYPAIILWEKYKETDLNEFKQTRNFIDEIYDYMVQCNSN